MALDNVSSVFCASVSSKMKLEKHDPISISVTANDLIEGTWNGCHECNLSQEWLKKISRGGNTWAGLWITATSLLTQGVLTLGAWGTYNSSAQWQGGCLPEWQEMDVERWSREGSRSHSWWVWLYLQRDKPGCTCPGFPRQHLFLQLSALNLQHNYSWVLSVIRSIK